MKFFLIVAKGKRQGEPIPIELDLFLIGSGKMCQLRAVHEHIGAQHCALATRDRKVFIRDLNSGQPTLVNGAEIPDSEEWPLHAGDIIEVGPLQFMVQYHEKALSRRDLEEWALTCLDADSARHLSAMDRLEAAAGSSAEPENAASAASAILDRLSAKKGIVKGRLRVSREEGLTVVRLNDLYLVDEAELALIKKELHDNLNRPNLRVLLDLKNIQRMSSAAAEMLADLKKWLAGFGNSLALCRLRPDLQQMLQAFPSAKSLTYFADKSDAFAEKW